MTFKMFCLPQCLRFMVLKRTVSKLYKENFKRAEHLVLTSGQFRQKKMYKTVVQKIQDLSPDIRTLSLKIEESGFSFKAGQWVDFYIPGVHEVGGYSLTSSPKLAEQERIIDLSVKYGSFPPTDWIHKTCKIGDVVNVRVGGDFYYDPHAGSLDLSTDLILVGGGVGINPMVSIARHYCDLLTTNNNSVDDMQTGKLKVLYTANSEEDLVFKDVFLNLAARCLSISNKFFVTSKQHPGSLDINDIFYKRIDEDDLKFALAGLNTDRVMCYICGPSSMIDDIEHYLLNLGVNKDHIKYEKWW